MSADAGQENTVDLAARRLERAVALLEQRLVQRLSEARESVNGALDNDRAQLAAELDQARARERELEEAGQAASMALSRAITEIRSALGE